MDVRWVYTRTFRSVLVSVLGMAVSLPWTGADSAAAVGPRPYSKALFPNPVRAAAVSPVDAKPPEASRIPAFVQSTGFPQAWRLLRRDVTAVIAVVDTGVDLTHPMLKPYLTNGINLVEPDKPPDDDNGHGTAVAGVIAAALGSAAGEPAAGARWTGRILPIKALDSTGTGDERRLAQGIRSAVERGADIVVLSLGLRHDDPGLREAVAWAESQGVLLVAAAGNDAAAFGAKAAVQFPAAYPEVLAVAGSEGPKPQPKSTGGPEVDISAAWQVETLSLGGTRTVMRGTSMGAPQAAAAAAMLKAAHPDWTPVSLREALRGSAEPAADPGWDVHTGYGYLRVDRAIAADHLPDWRDRGDVRGGGSVFPLGKEVTGTWMHSSDVNWYNVRIPYDGIYTVSGDGQTRWAQQLSLYDSKGAEIEPLKPDEQTSEVRWPADKGEYRLRAAAEGRLQTDETSYRLVSKLQIEPDSMEPNDRPMSAFTLAARNQSWSGTFHHNGDQDWTVVTLPKDGTLRVKVDTDTTRIDPAFMIQPAGGIPAVADAGGEGEPEELVLRDVQAGKYYIRIINAVSADPEPAVGTYKATMEYITQYDDRNEPNGGALTATPVSSGQVYGGRVKSGGDEDWFRLTISGKREVKVSLKQESDQPSLVMALMDKKLQMLNEWHRTADRPEITGTQALESGTYFLAVRAEGTTEAPRYSLEVQTAPTAAPITEQADGRPAESTGSVFWASWPAAYADGRFLPDYPVTGFIAADLMVRTARILQMEFDVVRAQVKQRQGALS